MHQPRAQTGLGLGVTGLGLRVQGLGFRGVGFRVPYISCRFTPLRQGAVIRECPGQKASAKQFRGQVKPRTSQTLNLKP